MTWGVDPFNLYNAKGCPGSAEILKPTMELVSCSRCGGEVEIWSDERKIPCPHCGNIIFQEAAPSCIDWCEHARECVGSDLYARLKGLDS